MRFGLPLPKEGYLHVWGGLAQDLAPHHWSPESLLPLLLLFLILAPLHAGNKERIGLGSADPKRGCLNVEA